VKRSLAHTVWECKYHIVWVPKKRRKIIFGKLRQEIGAILRRLSEYKGVELLEGKACIDHIHLCGWVHYVSAVGLDEAKIRKYIKDQEENESIEDKYDTDLSNPF